MEEKERAIIEKIKKDTPLKKIFWKDFLKYFNDDITNSPVFFEILNEMQTLGIEITDPIEYKETISELDNCTYIIAQANSFSEILPTLKKYKDGDLFCEYISGGKIQIIADKYKLTPEEATKKIKRFTRYISCPEIELPLLGVYIKYDIKPKDFSLAFNTDLITAKYLFLKFATLSNGDKSKHKISEDIENRISSFSLRKEKS